MEIEPGSLEVFVEGKTLFNSLQEIESLTQKDLDLHPINFGDEDEPIMVDFDVELPKGTIMKLIGRNLAWEDAPVDLKYEFKRI